MGLMRARESRRTLRRALGGLSCCSILPFLRVYLRPTGESDCRLSACGGGGGGKTWVAGAQGRGARAQRQNGAERHGSGHKGHK